MYQLVRNNRIANKQVGAFDGKSQQNEQENSENSPIGNEFNPIFIIAPKPEFVVHMQNQTSAPKRGLLSIFQVQDYRSKRIRRIWMTIRGRLYESILNVNTSEIAKVFYDPTFRKEDVLIVSGVIQVIIGIGTLLADSVAGYLGNQKPSHLTIVLSLFMILSGVVFCLARLILFEPRICPCLFTTKQQPKKAKPLQHSAFYFAANSALRVSVAIAVRYGRNRSLVDFNHIIQRDVCTSQGSVTNVMMFKDKLLKKLKSSKFYQRLSSPSRDK